MSYSCDWCGKVSKKELPVFGGNRDYIKEHVCSICWRNGRALVMKNRRWWRF